MSAAKGGALPPEMPRFNEVKVLLSPASYMMPLHPSEARKLADAGVPGVPDFVALTGRPLPTRAFDRLWPPAGPISLDPETKGLTE